MARQRLSIGSMLMDIVKSQEKFKSGALSTSPYRHFFSEIGTTLSSGKALPPRPDMNGRNTGLIKGKGVSNCPLPPGDFPVFIDSRDSNARASVPWKNCTKCPHHIESVRPRRHYCAELKRIRATSPSGIEEALNTFGMAVNEANDMIGGS